MIVGSPATRRASPASEVSRGVGRMTLGTGVRHGAGHSVRGLPSERIRWTSFVCCRAGAHKERSRTIDDWLVDHLAIDDGDRAIGSREDLSSSCQLPR